VINPSFVSVKLIVNNSQNLNCLGCLLKGATWTTMDDEKTKGINDETFFLNSLEISISRLYFESIKKFKRFENLIDDKFDPLD
jgi:hypothetical protein